jgi:hypothetical protein
MVLIDALLTPENAGEYGYQWVTDLMPAILKGEVRDIEDLKDKQSWRMGKAKIAGCILGLYKPVKKKSKPV